jgi:hypothetical protein
MHYAYNYLYNSFPIFAETDFIFDGLAIMISEHLNASRTKEYFLK